MLIRIFLALIFSFNDLAGFAQVSADSLFERTLLLNDLDSLREVIIMSHPDPSAFCGIELFDAIFLQEKSGVDTLTSVRDFTATIARCLNTMRDSHTTVDYGQLQNMQLADSGRYVPLSLKSINRNCADNEFDILVSGHWTAGIPKGSRLLSINGVSASDIYTHALEYACVEGSSEDARKSIATALIPVISGLRSPYIETRCDQYRDCANRISQV